MIKPFESAVRSFARQHIHPVGLVGRNRYFKTVNRRGTGEAGSNFQKIGAAIGRAEKLVATGINYLRIARMKLHALHISALYQRPGVAAICSLEKAGAGGCEKYVRISGMQ